MVTIEHSISSSMAQILSLARRRLSQVVRRPGLSERFDSAWRALGTGHLGERVGHSRQRRREVRELNERKQQSEDPVKVVVGEKGYQRQDGYNFILNFFRAMSHVLGKGMQ